MQPKDRDAKTLWFYDWGHNEAPFYVGQVWDVRAAAFMGADMPLPQAQVEPHEFWGRFRFDPGARLYLADSHSLASNAMVLEGVDKIWNFDAHHDCGYRPGEDADNLAMGRVGCSNWGLYAHLVQGAKFVQRYPRWKTRAFEAEQAPSWVEARFEDPNEVTRTFDRVFVCRSSAWVPPWCDEAFEEFWQACPVPLAYSWYGPSDPEVPRVLNMPWVKELIGQDRQAKEAMDAARS